MITRKDILAHLERDMRLGFAKGQDGYVAKRGAFVEEMDSDRAYEVFADLGATPWPVQNGGRLGSGGVDDRTEAEVTGGIHAGGEVQVGDFPERKIMLYPVDWEVLIDITHNAIDDDATGDVKRKAESAAIRFEQHMDWVCFNALNGGDGTTWGKGYDGQNLFSASHTDPGASYQTAQNNLGTSTLSLDNLKTIKIAASKLLDNTGQPMGLQHNLLIVPTDLEWEAGQITSNPMAYDTANNEKNPYAGQMQSLVAPGGYMDTTAWVLIDNSSIERPLFLVKRKVPTMSFTDNELAGDGGVRTYKWHARYNLAYGDWRLAYMGKS